MIKVKLKMIIYLKNITKNFGRNGSRGITIMDSNFLEKNDGYD